MLRLCLLLVLAALAAPGSADITGKLHVIDGDTVAIGTERVRLHGIDAVERGQKCGGGQGIGVWDCGDWVSDRVARRFDGRVARCDVIETDRFGRSVARCDESGQDMGQWIVREGLAVAYTEYSTAYLADEQAAERAGRGLHNVDFAAPDDYRRLRREARVKWNAASAEVPPGCRIKGNVSYNGGNRIYHLPGQRYYDKTVVTEARGERWFCSEEEARSAGWRRAMH